MAHGTPLPEANAPLASIAAAVARRGGFALHDVAYLDCNAPDIPGGMAGLAARGAAQIVALPYFLHLGRHVRDDLPRLVSQAAAALPQATIVRAQHLDYDPLLVDVLAARIAPGATIGADMFNSDSHQPHRQTVGSGG
jgi:sirohydrochlorin cobaltochelatase